jgi:hypothetical protein
MGFVLRGVATLISFDLREKLRWLRNLLNV